MKVRRPAYAGGAEITGIDLSREPDQATVGAIRSTWLDHLVPVFSGQQPTHEDHIRVR